MAPPVIRFWERIVLFLAQGCGLGWSPVAPGTFGSLGGILLVWGLQQVPLWWGVTAAVAFAVVGVWICTQAGRILGREDPGSVVWDEIAAFPIVFAGTALTPVTAILGFLWFRLFDVSKPYPISKLEKLPRGWGVMSDDLLAGVFAWMGLRATLWIWGILQNGGGVGG